MPLTATSSAHLPRRPHYALHQKISRVVLTFSVPPLLLGVAVLLLVNKTALRIEYARDGFPPDQYGWSLEERIAIADDVYAFLLSAAEPEEAAILLENAVVPGANTSAFTTREIAHMIDVKNVLDTSRYLVFLLLLLDAVALVLFVRGGAAIRVAAARAVRHGAQLALLLPIVLAAFFSNLPWDILFTRFHALFFEGGTWTFPPSSTLIRLFPTLFWQHMAIYIVVLYIVMSLILLIGSMLYAGRYAKYGDSTGV